MWLYRGHDSICSQCVWMWHVWPVAPSIGGCAWAAAGRNAASRTRADIHGSLIHMEALTPHALASKLCGRYAKQQMPTTIPRLLCWLHFLSLFLTHKGLALGPASDSQAFSWRGVYEYLQFSTTRLHKNTWGGSEQRWKWTKESSADFPAGS